MRLNELSDNPGATKRKKRVGRGPGSGIGKMGGRGIKGQKSRSGVAIKGFEGGQMPIHMRMPKRGFNNPGAKRFAVINLGILQKFIDAGKIDPAQPITEEVLVASGMVRRKRDGVRLLAKGTLTAQGLQVAVTGASKQAIETVAAAGGSVSVAQSAAAAESADAG